MLQSCCNKRILHASFQHFRFDCCCMRKPRSSVLELLFVCDRGCNDKAVHLPCVCIGEGLPSLGDPCPPVVVAEVAPPDCSSVADREGRAHCIRCSSHFRYSSEKGAFSMSKLATRGESDMLSNQSLLTRRHLHSSFVHTVCCPAGHAPHSSPPTPLLAVVATWCFCSLTLFNYVKLHCIRGITWDILGCPS